MAGGERRARSGSRELSDRSVLLLLLVASGAAPAPGLAAAAVDSPGFEQFSVRADAERIVVSFRLAGLPAEADLERLRSGLSVSYRHRIEALAGRPVPLWPAKVIARATIDVTAEYDSLTDRYDLVRRIERRGGGEPVVERHRTASADEMRAWLVDVADLELTVAPDAVAAERFRVRAQSTVGRRDVLWLFSAKQTLATEWRPPEGAAP